MSTGNERLCVILNPMLRLATYSIAVWLIGSLLGCNSTSLVAKDGADLDGLEEFSQVSDDGGLAGEEADHRPESEPTCDPSGLQVVERGLIERDLPSNDNELAICSKDVWVFVAARGSKLEIKLTAQGYHLLLGAVSYPDDLSWNNKLASLSASADQAGVLEFLTPRSGEYFLQIRSIDPELASSYSLELTCLAGCELETTRFPIVMVHGWTGWDEIGPLEYFYNVPDTLKANGYGVFVASLDPYNSVEIRSGQLAEQLEQFLEQGRARKVNIIGHSQGCLDARRAISTLGFGDRVSAFISFAGPHQGTPIADIGLGLLPGPAEEALAFMLNMIGATGGNESDALASFQSLTTDYVINEFNPQNPDDPRVTYISWTGLTCPLGIECGDICDIEIRWAYNLIYLEAGDNDGMVPVSSAPWGDFRGTVPADHFDEIGQVLGITGPNFDHLEFYKSLARDLAAEGH